MKIILIFSLLLSYRLLAITGGHESDSDYMEVVRLSKKGYGNGCSAVKVASKKFLTSAHCFSNFARDIDFTEYMTTNEDPYALTAQIFQHGKTVSVSVKSLRFHPSWHRHIKPGMTDREIGRVIGSGVVSDLSIFEVTEDTPVKTAVISFDESLFAENAPMAVAGYGATEKNKSPILPSWGAVFVYSLEKTYIVSLPQKIENLCTSKPQVAVQPGDSGGPAYALSKNGGSLVVVGINSGISSAEHPESGCKFNVTLSTRLDVAKEWLCQELEGELGECTIH